MTRYVFDASVALKLVLPEIDSHQDVAVQQAYYSGAYELIAPDIFVAEVAHGLTKAERRPKPILQPGEAATGLAKLLAYPPTFHPTLPLIMRAVDISTHMRIASYDCIYLALAEREGCLLITADAALLNAFPALTISLANV